MRRVRHLMEPVAAVATNAMRGRREIQSRRRGVLPAIQSAVRCGRRAK